MREQKTVPNYMGKTKTGKIAQGVGYSIRHGWINPDNAENAKKAGAQIASEILQKTGYYYNELSPLAKIKAIRSFLKDDFLVYNAAQRAEIILINNKSYLFTIYGKMITKHYV